MRSPVQLCIYSFESVASRRVPETGTELPLGLIDMDSFTLFAGRGTYMLGSMHLCLPTPVQESRFSVKAMVLSEDMSTLTMMS